MAEASRGPWSVQRGEHGRLLIATGRPDGGCLYVNHDAEPAPEDDVAFIAKARNVLPRLLLAATTGDPSLVTSDDLGGLEELLPHVTAAPWIAFIEGKDHVGGNSMIRISHVDFGPDMNIWLEDKIAPDADIELIAAAREAVPILMSEIRSCEGRRGSPVARLMPHASKVMPRMAAVYRTERSFIVDSLERTPPGFWIGASPCEVLPLGVGVADLGRSVLEALRRSREARDYQASRKPRDGELLKAAGYRSHKKFFEASTFCTVRSETDELSRRAVRSSSKDMKHQAWLPDRDTLIVDGDNAGAIGRAVKDALSP